VLLPVLFTGKFMGSEAVRYWEGLVFLIELVGDMGGQLHNSYTSDCTRIPTIVI
jgi:hypothetical protein